jgi:purine-binding chemotaxis protein CheW
MEAIVEVNTGPPSPALAEGVRSVPGGKFLTFSLDREEFGVQILKVVEIIGVLDITVVPHTQEFVRGVINLRGKVIPVIDLRAKFGIPETAYNDQTCIIVVDVGTLMGIVVDTVQEVHDIESQDIEPPPSLGRTVGADFILGMGKVKDDVKILLDIDRVLNGDELVELPEHVSRSEPARA